MLNSHMNAVEETLIKISKIPANSGHTLHKGTPRESFIKNFLKDHLSSNVSIGTGEIIDANSKPNETRNQYDIVIFKNNYPKLDFGGGINGFLIESVVATIEVKSLLDKPAIKQSIKAAHKAKSLKPNTKPGLRSGWIPPKVLNYVVAYEGPQKLSTVHKWIMDIHKVEKISMPEWDKDNRLKTPGTALDGVILLKKGFIKLDNTPLSLNNPDNFIDGTHMISNNSKGNLLVLFLSLQEACDNFQSISLDSVPYVKSAKYKNVKIL